jgi:hypothetical protein
MKARNNGRPFIRIMHPHAWVQHRQRQAKPPPHRVWSIRPPPRSGSTKRGSRITSFARWSLILCLAGGLAGAGVWAQETTTEQPAPAPSILDNLFLELSAGAEDPPREDRTAFGSMGATWAIPLTPPGGVAWGLQLGGSVKAREVDPELNGTIGGFARNFATFRDQQGAFAALLDYRRTAFDNDLWALRPIIGTTVSPLDALGVEAVAGLSHERRQEVIDQFVTFWTRDWTDVFATELGLGYQFSHVNETLLRGRAAIGLSQYVSLGFGGDMNTEGDYAIGASLSYHFGGTGRHPSLHNIAGRGSGLYTPFPDASFPSLLHRTK